MNGLKVNIQNPDKLAPIFVDGLLVGDSGGIVILNFTAGTHVAVEVMPTVNIKATLIVTPEFAGKISAALLEHLAKMKARKKVKTK